MTSSTSAQRRQSERPRSYREGVLSAIAIIPSAPVLVPQLLGGAAAELTDLRQAVFAAASALPERWLSIGVGHADEVVGPRDAGTFAGYGVDLAVGLSPDAGPDVVGVGALPLSALITAWVRGEVRPSASAEVRVFGREHSAKDAIRRGAGLRSAVDDTDDPVGVLVVADGANTLTPRAPGGHDPGSVAVQITLDEALAAGDVEALARLPSSITGRVAWQVLAGLAGAPPRSVKELYRGAPFGVGYFVGVWLPEGWSVATEESTP
jgi:hypothetical protein